MDVRELWATYDLTESTVLDVRWSNAFRTLEVQLDYFWDLSALEQPKPGPSRIMVLQLDDCLWATFQWDQDPLYKKIKYGPDAFTVIGWRIDESIPGFVDVPHLTEALANGYHYLMIQSAHSPKKPWIQVICREIRLVDAADPG